MSSELSGALDASGVITIHTGMCHTGDVVGPHSYIAARRRPGQLLSKQRSIFLVIERDMEFKHAGRKKSRLTSVFEK